MMGTDEEDMDNVALPPSEQASSPTAAADSEANAQYVMKESTWAYAGVIVASIVLLISLTAAGNFDNHKYYAYGISVASIAMICAAIGWGVAEMVPDQAQAVRYINYFLFAWCFVGASFMTFGGPFLETGNGYFGSWGLAVFATMALGINATTITDKAQTGGPLAGLFASSVVLLVAIASHTIKKSNPYFGELIYSIIVVCLTILATGAMLKGVEQFKPVTLPITAVLAALWIATAILLTFRGPFLLTGNGYFAAWGGCLSSAFAVVAARKSLAAAASEG